MKNKKYTTLSDRKNIPHCQTEKIKNKQTNETKTKCKGQIIKKTNESKQAKAKQKTKKTTHTQTNKQTNKQMQKKTKKKQKTKQSTNQNKEE
jgi:hypothetical protein